MVCHKEVTFPCTKETCSIVYSPLVAFDQVVLNVYGVYKGPADPGPWPTEHLIGSVRITGREAITGTGHAHEIVTDYGRKVGTLQWSFINSTLWGRSDLDYNESRMLVSKKGVIEHQLNIAQTYMSTMISSISNHINDKFEYHPGFGAQTSSFSEVWYRGYQIPYAILLTSMQSLKASASAMEGVFSWWLLIGLSNMGLMTLPPASDRKAMGALIGELFTVFFKGCIYSADHVVTGQNTYEDEEQWMPVGSFPNLHTIGYDCEDGTLYCTELLHAFKKATFINPDLRTIQTYLLNFSICSAIGQLKKASSETGKDEYGMHAFCLLIDRRRFTGKVVEDVYPTILLESTNYFSSIFAVKDDNKEVDTARYEAQDAALQDIARRDMTEEMHLRYIIGMKAPSVSIVHAHMFGLLEALYTDDDGTASSSSSVTPLYHHYLAVSKEHKNVIGIPLHGLLFGDFSGATFMKMQTVNTKDMEICRPVLACIPPARLPGIKHIKEGDTPSPLAPDHWRFIVKDLTSVVGKEASCLERIQEKLKGETKRVLLFDDCPVLFIDVKKQSL